MHTLLKVLSIVFAISAACVLALSFLFVGSAFYSLPEYKTEIREKIAEDRPKFLVERSADIANNIRSLWASHTSDQEMSMFFLTRGAISFSLFGITLFLWVIALQFQILALSIKKKTEQGATANP